MAFITTGGGGAASLEVLQDTLGPTFTDTATVNFTYDDGANIIYADVIASAIDHGGLAGLADDDHTQYFKVTGRTNESLTISGTGVILNSDGAVGTPSYSFSSDTNTGLYRSAVDEISVAIGGNQRFILDTDGRLSCRIHDILGTTSGSVSLRAQPTTTTYVLRFPDAQGGVDSVLRNDGSGIFSWVSTYLPTSPTTNALVSGFNPSIMTGIANTVFGRNSGAAITTGLENTLIGANVGTALTTGSANIAVGEETLDALTTGHHNTVVGLAAMHSSIIGEENVALGYSAVRSGTAAHRNVGIGYRSLFTTTGSNNIAIGYYSGNLATSSNELYLGNIAQGSNADEKAYSLLYGQFSGSAASLTNQQLTLNGKLNVNGGPILNSDGAVGTPSYSFSSDANTGLYHTATADEIAISNAGVQSWRFNPSGHFLAGTDNAVDIGNSAANRPRTIRAATSYYVGTNADATAPYIGISGAQDRMKIVSGTQLELHAGATPAAMAFIYNDGAIKTFQMRGTGLTFYTDNGFDIGRYTPIDTTLERPRDVYVGTNLYLGGASSVATSSNSKIFFGASSSGNTYIASSVSDTGDLKISSAASSRIAIFANNELTLNLNGPTFGNEAKFYSNVNIPAGAAATPSLSFGSDSNTGIYNDAADDKVKVATGGTLRLTVDTTAVTATLPHRGPEGTESAPAYSFSGDSNTGIWSDLSDAIKFTTGGTNRVTLQASSLDSAVPIFVPDGSAGNPSLALSSDSDTGFYWPGVANQLGITIGGTSRAIISTTELTSTLPIGLSSNSSLSSTADLVQLGGYDLSAGNRTLAISTETAVGGAPAAADASLTVRINGVNYKIHLTAV